VLAQLTTINANVKTERKTSQPRMVAKPLNHDGNSDTENNNDGKSKHAEGKAPVVTNK